MKRNQERNELKKEIMNLGLISHDERRLKENQRKEKSLQEYERFYEWFDSKKLKRKVEKV